MLFKVLEKGKKNKKIKNQCLRICYVWYCKMKTLKLNTDFRTRLVEAFKSQNVTLGWHFCCFLKTVVIIIFLFFIFCNFCTGNWILLENKEISQRSISFLLTRYVNYNWSKKDMSITYIRTTMMQPCISYQSTKSSAHYYQLNLMILIRHPSLGKRRKTRPRRNPKSLKVPWMPLWTHLPLRDLPVLFSRKGPQVSHWDWMSKIPPSFGFLSPSKTINIKSQTCLWGT